MSLSLDEVRRIARLARLRLSHPLVEGSASGRWESPGYLPYGSSRTLHGTLRSEGQLQATFYPARWAPASVFFTRQRSAAEASCWLGWKPGAK